MILEDGNSVRLPSIPSLTSVEPKSVDYLATDEAGYGIHLGRDRKKKLRWFRLHI